MIRKRKNAFQIMTKTFITVALSATVMLLFLPSCTEEQKKLGPAISEKDSIPDLSTTDVNTFISDSGKVKYHITTPEWLIYTKTNPSRWSFRKGIYLEKYDSLFHVDATIKADTAYYFDMRRLWELRGNVHIQNQQGTKFDTQLLYWDQSSAKIYSDKFIKIVKKDTVLTGFGFESNQEMTEYQVNNVNGYFTLKNTENKK